MGTWTLASLDTKDSDLDGETFGTNFHVIYKLRYKPSFFTKFKEPPKLDWHEKILMKEHHKKEWWEFETNMYTHNPLSNTLKVWPGRYRVAYQLAFNQPRDEKGSSRLLDKDGAQVAGADVLEEGLTDGVQQADEIRHYLSEYGGFLEIEIHDIPSINKPKTNTERKERLLLFDVGVVGNTETRLKAEQYLDVDGAVDKSQWVREFTSGSWVKNWDSADFKKVDAPVMVSNPRTPVFMAGELW